jgi:hypothetical protein
MPLQGRDRLGIDACMGRLTTCSHGAWSHCVAGVAELSIPILARASMIADDNFGELPEP